MVGPWAGKQGGREVQEVRKVEGEEVMAEVRVSSSNLASRFWVAVEEWEGWEEWEMQEVQEVRWVRWEWYLSGRPGVP